MKAFLIACALLSSLFCDAEIIIEYKVTPLKDNPFLEEFEVIPYKMVVTVGEDYENAEPMI